MLLFNGIVLIKNKTKLCPIDSKLRAACIKGRKWSIYLFSFFAIIAIRLITVLFLEINNNNYNFGSSYLWISSTLWLIIYFKIITSPEILYGYNFLNEIVNISMLDDN